MLPCDVDELRRKRKREDEEHEHKDEYVGAVIDAAHSVCTALR